MLSETKYLGLVMSDPNVRGVGNSSRMASTSTWGTTNCTENPEAMDSRRRGHHHLCGRILQSLRILFSQPMASPCELAKVTPPLLKDAYTVGSLFVPCDEEIPASVIKSHVEPEKNDHRPMGVLAIKNSDSSIQHLSGSDCLHSKVVTL